MNALLLVFSAALAQSPSPWVELVRSGVTCSLNRSEAMECHYKVNGREFLDIAGVGDPDPGMLVVYSDLDGDVYVKFAPGTHRCAIVGAGADIMREYPLQYAFISGFTGKVFDNYEECDASR